MMSLLPDSMDLSAPLNPPVSEREFRAVMGSLASSVGVVTSAHDGEVLGRTVTSLFSLALTPPTLLVSIDMMSRLADLISKSRRFSVAILASDQQVVGDAFAGRFGDMDRFAFGVWGQWPSGNPQLYGAATSVDCELVGTMEAGGHLLFAGTPIEAEVTAKEPLLWHKKHYRMLGE